MSRKQSVMPSDQWTPVEIDMIMPKFDFENCRDQLKIEVKSETESIRFSEINWDLSKITD